MCCNGFSAIASAGCISLTIYLNGILAHGTISASVFSIKQLLNYSVMACMSFKYKYATLLMARTNNILFQNLLPLVFSALF